MTVSETFISIKSVNKYFGSFQAVSDVSLGIEHGEFFSLLGPSGCGKTTLLRMLAGFESPTTGEILIDGQPMSDVPPHHRPVNMVFQSYAIFPHLNVRDNIAYGLRRQKLPKTKRYEMVDEMLDLIKLPDYGDRRADELSGGQRQRVALSRALILKPKVLLLDEPLGALDKQLREQMQLELRALQRTVGITFVFVTHDQEEALTLSDRIAVMSRGRVLQTDTPTRLYEAPSTREVASFIGTMNIFNGTVKEVGEIDVVIDTEGLGVVRAPKPRAAVSNGKSVQVAICPEKLVLSSSAPNSGLTAVRGQLENAAYLGERSHYYVRLQDMDQPVAVSTQNRQPITDIQAENRSVWLGWSDDAVVVLDADWNNDQHFEPEILRQDIMNSIAAKGIKTNKEAGRTASKEVRRRQLIDATIESISKHGLSGTTMTKVTGFAGLSMGIVNFHFDSKDNLYRETLRFLAEEHRDQWKQDCLKAAQDPAAQLLAIVDSDFHPNLCNRKKLTVWYAFYGEAAYRKHYRQIMSEIDSERWNKSRDLCRQIVEDGKYYNVDPDGVAKTLEGFFDGFCLNILIYPDDFTREDGKRQVREYLVATFPKHFVRPNSKDREG